MEKEVVVVGRDVAVSISTTMLMVYNMIDSNVWVVVVMIYVEEQRRRRRRCLLVEVVEEDGIFIYGKEGRIRKERAEGHGREEEEGTSMFFVAFLHYVNASHETKTEKKSMIAPKSKLLFMSKKLYIYCWVV